MGRVVRVALSDFYFNSGRLVVVNVVWGAAVIGLWLVWLVWPLVALILTPLLAFPTVGIFRVAARIVRQDGHASVQDALAAFRDYAAPTLLLGLATVAASLILGTNAIVGLTQSEPLGWFVGTLAMWGLVVLWCSTIVTWPLVVDPERTGYTLGKRLRLVGLLLLAHPVRFALLGALVVMITAVSTILLAALLTISVSFVALIACRYVYPAADRLEAQGIR
jgi:uncharacterized membrane protein YesL